MAVGGGPPIPVTKPEQSAAPVAGYEKSFPALGTLVTFKAFHAEQQTVEKAFELAEQRVHELNSILTDYDPSSETRQLSLRAPHSPVKVSSDLWNVLVASDNWHRRTGGAFDASLGSLTRLWRKYRRVGKVPEDGEVQIALKACGWEHVILDSQQRTVHFRIEGLRLDFGAIGKGYIVDEAFKVLKENGLSCSLVNISGNMRCGDRPPEREGWRIQVSSLDAGGQPLREILLSKVAIATSGDLWQFSIIDGQRRSHILDPKTGVGVLGPVSASVVAESAADADALATAACILDWPTVDALSKRLVATEGFASLEVLVARRDSDNSLSIQSTVGFPANAEGISQK